MPNEVQIPHIEQANLDQESVISNQEKLETRQALALVMQTFNQYETFRSQNHDRRWNVHDELYFGWVPAKTWDGTTTPRANLGIPIVFDQVESIVPKISQALFSIGQDWFQVTPEKDTSLDEARQVQDAISYILEHPSDDCGLSAKAEIELAIRSVALYGNGGVSIEWNSRTQRPQIRWVDIRDIYFDPGCVTPSVDDSRGVIQRRMMTVDELLELAGDERMDIPSPDQLATMANGRTSTVGDTTKSVQEAIRGVLFTPGTSDWMPNPADRKVEVLVYHSRSRIIWILNREWVAYNQPNPYNFIQFCFAPCYIVPGRAYAQSIADVQEGTQRYIQALINARLDELALAVHPPRIMPRSANMTPAQMKWKPGAIYAVDKPKDTQVLLPAGATANVFPEVQYLELNADRRTGISSLSNGVPRPSNANRTKGGMAMQLQGSSERVSQIVSHIEEYLVVPLLYKIYKMLQIHAGAGAQLPAMRNGQSYTVNGDALYKPMKFRMAAASRMVTRDQLLQVLPLLAQVLMQAGVMDALQKEGKTLDFDEWSTMVQDATSISKVYNLVRPLTDQEKQTLQQPDKNAQMQMQQRQMEQQTKLQLAREGNQTKLQVEQMKKQPDEASKVAMQIEMQKAQMEMAQRKQEAQQKLFQETMLNKIKLQAEQQFKQMELEAKRGEMALKSQDHSMKMQQSQVSHQMKLQQMFQQLQADRVNAEERAKFPQPQAETSMPADPEAKVTPGAAEKGARPAKKEPKFKKTATQKGE